jgi:FkbM family methyltransferase
VSNANAVEPESDGINRLRLHEKVWYKAKLFGLDGILRPLRPGKMLRYGTYYGGWWIPSVAPEEGVAICVGAGLDISFDLELLRLGYDVFTVDPTPASVEYIRETAPEITLIQKGIWDSEGTISFQQGHRWHDSWSISTVRRKHVSDNFVTLPVTTVRSLIDSLGIERVAILKLDIEGVEHNVVRSLVNDGVRPRTLCVEFDDQRLRKILRSTWLLRSHGYDLIQIENFNFTFVLRA